MCRAACCLNILGELLSLNMPNIIVEKVLSLNSAIASGKIVEAELKAFHLSDGDWERGVTSVPLVERSFGEREPCWMCSGDHLSMRGDVARRDPFVPRDDCCGVDAHADLEMLHKENTHTLEAHSNGFFKVESFQKKRTTFK